MGFHSISTIQNIYELQCDLKNPSFENSETSKIWHQSRLLPPPFYLHFQFAGKRKIAYKLKTSESDRLSDSEIADTAQNIIADNTNSSSGEREANKRKGVIEKMHKFE